MDSSSKSVLLGVMTYYNSRTQALVVAFSVSIVIRFQCS